MTADDFRRLALGFEGTTEGAHMDHPDFRANGKIFATIYPDYARGMVKLTPEEQESFTRADRDIFEPASGAWGRRGCTTVLLASADEEIVGDAMTLAWQATTRPPSRRKSTRKSTPGI